MSDKVKWEWAPDIRNKKPDGRQAAMFGYDEQRRIVAMVEAWRGRLVVSIPHAHGDSEIGIPLDVVRAVLDRADQIGEGQSA
jgi:hypothetical protein